MATKQRTCAFKNCENPVSGYYCGEHQLIKFNPDVPQCSFVHENGCRCDHIAHIKVIRNGKDTIKEAQPFCYTHTLLQKYRKLCKTENADKANQSEVERLTKKLAKQERILQSLKTVVKIGMFEDDERDSAARDTRQPGTTRRRRGGQKKKAEKTEKDDNPFEVNTEVSDN